MFRKKAKINSVNFWLAYCVSLASRRHGVYINREEIKKLYPKENENITFGELNQFLSKKKLVADVVNINLNDLTRSEFILPCVVPLKNGGSIIILNIEKKENEVKLKILDPIESQGDGIAMAWRAGARCFNLQYIQFHPTALFHESGRFLISEAIRGEGGKLYDVNGNEFMNNIHKDHSLAPRDIVARGIHQTLIATNHPCVYLDISHKDSAWIKNRFPAIYKHCLNHGIDITAKPIPVVPAAHYSCGGIGVNLTGRTSLKRLYAIGEVSCTGVHGANRLASTSLLECLVWGYLAGKNAANYTEDHTCPATNDWIQESETIDPALIAQDWLTIKNTMWNSVGLIRTRDRLHRAHHVLRNLQYDIEQFYQHAQLTPDIIGLRNGIQTALAITSAALEDRDSKGCHYIIN